MKTKKCKTKIYIYLWPIHKLIYTLFRMKYIDEQVALRTGRTLDKDDDNVNPNKSIYCPPELAALQAVPSHLRNSTTHRSEEMLSNQMLSGIPEVDLGIE